MLANVLYHITLIDLYMYLFSAGDYEVTAFIVDVLPKLLLVHHSSSPESFATVVLEHLQCDEERDAMPE